MHVCTHFPKHIDNRESESLETQPSALEAQFDRFGTSLDRGSDYVLCN